MPRGGHPSRTPTPSAGPSASKITPSRFSLLQEMMSEDNLWESGSDSSTHSDYENYRDSDDDTVASTMLYALTGQESRTMNTGKGKLPAPKNK